jgi:hypothetical protein
MEVRENRAGSRPKQTAREHLEELLDEALMATFPASDPIAVGREFLEVLEQQPDASPALTRKAAKARGRCETPSQPMYLKRDLPPSRG